MLGDAPFVCTLFTCMQTYMPRLPSKIASIAATAWHALCSAGSWDRIVRIHGDPDTALTSMRVCLSALLHFHSSRNYVHWLQAQEVAQLAINANDNYQGAQARVEVARAELEAAQQEKDFLTAELAKLQSELALEGEGGEGEDAAIETALVTGEKYLLPSVGCLSTIAAGDNRLCTLNSFIKWFF